MHVMHLLLLVDYAFCKFIYSIKITTLSSIMYRHYSLRFWSQFTFGIIQIDSKRIIIHIARHRYPTCSSYSLKTSHICKRLYKYFISIFIPTPCTARCKAAVPVFTSVTSRPKKSFKSSSNLCTSCPIPKYSL